MKRCPKCNNDFSDDANFCPVDAGHLVPIEGSSDGTPVDVPRVDTGGHELLDGRFALGEIIGGHQTGPVYSAGDRQGSTAMVKLVNAAVFPSSLLKQRTERELKQLERLEHPGVARVLGHGRREEDLWIASERVDGVPLSQFVAERGPLPQQAAIAILAQIGGALEAAAKLGVTHRDLAPKNVLISADHQIKLINFGVPTPGPAGREQVQGVPEFVAPEQIDGRPVDQRCNIYSLGAIGYVLLTGKPPFEGAAADVYAAHTNTEVPALGPAQGVSAELSAVLLKSLEKTSSKRFMTLRQFLGDLAAADGSQAQAQAPAKSAADANKTLMGISPVDLSAMLAAKNASPPIGTPPPPADSGNVATTLVDHAPPSMSDAQAAQAQNNSTPLATPLSDVGFAPTAVSNAFDASQAPAAPVPAAPQPSHVAPAGAPSVGAATVSAAPSGKKKGAAKPAPAKPSDKGKFRETMWFKKGELDEAAAAAAAAAKPEDRVSDKADLMEMDVRYNDDGSITQQDQERLSLRTGATMMMEAVTDQQSSQQGVSEYDLVSEMTGGRIKILIGIGAAVAIIAVVLVIALS